MIFERKSFLFIQLDMMSLALSQSIYINDGYKKLENISDSHKCVVICYLRQQQEILFVDTLQNSYFNLLEVATIILLQSVCNFKVGDRVKLREGKTGVVKYIGKPEFPQEELVGIELDTWSANARDGSIGDQKFFKTSSGRGYFTPNTSVANIIKAKITEGAYARLKGMLRIPKFNGKTVKIVAYVQKKERWKVKLLHAKQEKRYLGVREENLDPILDWEPLNESNEVKIEGLKFEPMIGDRVQTRNGRYGIVKYVGKVDNSKSVYVGLKLEEYDPNAHDGTFKDHKYFECMDHRGYFVKLENLIENLGKANDGYTNLQNIGDYEKCLVYGYLRKQQEILFSHKLKNHYFNLLEVASIILFQSDGVLLKPKIGDRVILLQGKTGLVKYIGTTQFRYYLFLIRIYMLD